MGKFGYFFNRIEGTSEKVVNATMKHIHIEFLYRSGTVVFVKYIVGSDSVLGLEWKKSDVKCHLKCSDYMMGVWEGEKDLLCISEQYRW